MHDNLVINIDEGTLWLIRQTLRRNGKPEADINDAVNEIKRIVEDQGGSKMREGRADDRP